MQDVLSSALHDRLFKKIAVWVDDVIIGGVTEAECLDNLEYVLTQ